MKKNGLHFIKTASVCCCAALCLFSPRQAPAENPGRITVQYASNVPGNAVLLGQIATIEGGFAFIQAAEQVVLGRAPLPGEQRIFK